MALDPNKVLPRRPCTEPLRAVFFGTPALAVPPLDALVAAEDVCEVVAVVAQPDRPAGRGNKLRAPPVAKRAVELGLDLRQPRGVRRGPFARRFAELKPDIAVVIAYGRILTSEILETPRFGCVNVHASLLPKYRGAGPIQWAIIEGESETGVTTAREAGVRLVYGRDVDAEGLSVVRVPADTPGLIVTELEKMGLRGARMGRVEIDCRLPPSALVGSPGSGMAQFQSALEWERASVGAAFVGAMQRGLDRCIEHARRRTQFGRPIGGFQAVAHRIVDMKLRLETSRLLLYRAADAKERGRAPVESSEAKLWIADALVANSLDAVRIFGAAGYLAEAEEARRLADAVGTPILSGTADIQRNLLAGVLGVAPPRR